MARRSDRAGGAAPLSREDASQPIGAHPSRKWGILLENGVIAAIGWRSHRKARESFDRWKRAHRQAAADPGAIAVPRLPIGLVRFKSAKPLHAAASRSKGPHDHVI